MIKINQDIIKNYVLPYLNRKEDKSKICIINNRLKKLALNYWKRDFDSGFLEEVISAQWQKLMLSGRVFRLSVFREN